MSEQTTIAQLPATRNSGSRASPVTESTRWRVDKRRSKKKFSIHRFALGCPTRNDESKPLFRVQFGEELVVVAYLRLQGRVQLPCRCQERFDLFVLRNEFFQERFVVLRGHRHTFEVLAHTVV